MPAVKEMLSDVSRKGIARLNALHTTFLMFFSGVEDAATAALNLFTSLDGILSVQVI